VFIKIWDVCNHFLPDLIIFLMVFLTIMLPDLKSLSNTSLHVKEDFRKGKNGFCLGLNRRHQWWMIQIPYHQTVRANWPMFYLSIASIICLLCSTNFVYQFFALFLSVCQSQAETVFSFSEILFHMSCVRQTFQIK
jgi:hypothetical protein